MLELQWHTEWFADSLNQLFFQGLSTTTVTHSAHHITIHLPIIHQLLSHIGSFPGPHPASHRLQNRIARDRKLGEGLGTRLTDQYNTSLESHTQATSTYIMQLSDYLHCQSQFWWCTENIYIRELADSLCRDGADTQYMQYLSKSHITSPQIH